MGFLNLLKKETENAVAAKEAGQAVDPAQVASELTGIDPATMVQTQMSPEQAALQNPLTPQPLTTQAPQAAAPKPEVTSADSLNEDSIPVIIDDIFQQAMAQKASDIHFKPSENLFSVFFRVDGSMIRYKDFDVLFHHPLVARIKIISGLRIDEHRLPQDGKTSYKNPEGKKWIFVFLSCPANTGKK